MGFMTFVIAKLMYSMVYGRYIELVSEVILRLVTRGPSPCRFLFHDRWDLQSTGIRMVIMVIYRNIREELKNCQQKVGGHDPKTELFVGNHQTQLGQLILFIVQKK